MDGTHEQMTSEYVQNVNQQNGIFQRLVNAVQFLINKRIKRKSQYDRNRETTLKWKREYYQKKKEEWSESNRKRAAVWYENNKEYVSERGKKFREENKERLVENRKEYYEENKEKCLNQQKKYREDNRDLIKERKRNQYLEDKEGCLRRSRKYANTPNGKYVSYKNGARTRKIEFKLSFEEFMKFWQLDCHYCGSKIKTIGIDRIASKKGYEVGNILPCCRTCNLMKRDTSYEVFVEQIKLIFKHLFSNVVKSKNDQEIKTKHGASLGRMGLW